MPTAPPLASRMTPRTAPDAAGSHRRPTLATAATRLANHAAPPDTRRCAKASPVWPTIRSAANSITGSSRTSWVTTPDTHARSSSLRSIPAPAGDTICGIYRPRQGSPSRPKYDTISYLTVRRVHGVRSVNASAASFARSPHFQVIAPRGRRVSVRRHARRDAASPAHRPRQTAVGESSPCVRLTRNTRVRETRISTRRAYGVQRVCRVWHRARSSVYARRQATRSPALCRRRGPIALPRTTSWWPTFAGCSKPRRFMARATEKPGRSCGSRGCAPRRSGCAG